MFKLREAPARGYNRFDNIDRVPSYQQILEDQSFEAFIHEWAREEIERLESSPSLSQHELRVIAQYYLVIDDLDSAERSMERAAELGGALDEKVANELDQIRRQRRIRELSGDR